MTKTVAALKRELGSLRAGRANPALLEGIEVSYYGTMTPLKQLAGISTPEPRLLVIQPWDKQSIADIEKAILKSDLGLTPSNDGNVIRLPFPELTEERRRELVRYASRKTEEARVAIRNLRREANDQLKKLQKDGLLSEDGMHVEMDRVQKLTDEFIDKVEKVFKSKEQEIMEV